MTESRLRQILREAAAGFPGRFEFDPAHSEDRGIGTIAEIAEFDDRLVYVPLGSELHDDDCYVIADPIDQHVGEALAQLLNAGLAIGRMPP